MVAQQEQTKPSRREITLAGNPVTLNNFLSEAKGKIAQALPKHMNVERVVRIASVVVSRSKDLGLCAADSILKCVVVAGQLGFELTPEMGEAYMVPFNNSNRGCKEAQLIIGYRGLCQLARRSGQISFIESRVVYGGEEFEWEYGIKPKLLHKPDVDSIDAGIKDTDLIQCVYAVAWYKDEPDHPQFVVLTKKQVDARRARSRASGSGPWVTDYHKMAMKTAVRELAPYLPMSIEFNNALAIDRAADLGEAMPEMVDGLLVSADAPHDPSPPPDGRSNFGFRKPQQQQTAPPPEQAQEQEQTTPQGVEETGGAGEDAADAPDELPPSTLNEGRDKHAQQSAPQQTQQRQQDPPPQQGNKDANGDMTALPPTADWTWITEYAVQRTPQQMKLTLLEVKGQMQTMIPKPWTKLDAKEKQAVLEKVNARQIQWKPGKATQATA